MAKAINSKKVKECLNGEGSEGLSLRIPNRWVNVYVALEPNAEGNFVETYHLNAGSEMLPADYFETHDTLESLVASMREVRDLRSWQPSSFFYSE